jgi:hypothetical protein
MQIKLCFSFVLHLQKLFPMCGMQIETGKQISQGKYLMLNIVLQHIPVVSLKDKEKF